MPEKLYQALVNGDEKIVFDLLQGKPELINIIFDEEELTPFELAIKGGFLSIAQSLIDGIDLKIKGHNPLLCAVNANLCPIVEKLLEKGANPNSKQVGMDVALNIALDRENFKIAEVLLKYKADVNIRDENGWTPLIRASIAGRLETVKYLLKNGADVDFCCHEGWNAATASLFRKNKEVYNFLTENGASITSNFATAALVACYAKGDIETATSLLKLSANPNAKLPNGTPILYQSIQNGDNQFCVALLQAGADPNTRNEHGVPCLCEVVVNGNTELTKKIIEYGANVNIRTSSGLTPLMKAAYINQIAIVKLLIEFNASVNCQDKNGNTALMFASSRDYRDVLEILIEAGANPYITNNENKNSFDVTYSSKTQKVLRGET